MSTVEVPTEVQDPAPASEAQKDPAHLFKWNGWVHVGDGAQECSAGRTGDCTVGGHFHAWVRLPNPFQVRDITDKATAAQARYKKLVRDPTSDEAAIFEEILEEIKLESKELLVEEVVDKHFPDDYTAAVLNVDELEVDDYVQDEDDEEPVVPKLFAGIDQDREEWQRQRLLPPEQRTDDFGVMEKNVGDYGEAVEAETKRLQQPRRDALMELPIDELWEMARRERVENKATEVYLHWFNAWQWMACTFKPCKKGTPSERVWKDINYMKLNATEEVILAVRATFEGLESNLAASRRGKGS